MGSANLPEELSRLLYLYVAEFILGVTMFFVFRHFGLLYKRRFLYTWALSWMAFAVYIAGSTITAVVIQQYSVQRLMVNIAAQMACFLQIIFVLRGTYELVTEKAFNRRNFQGILVITLVVVLISVMAFAQNVDSGQFRFSLRVGSRTLITGLGFLLAGIVVLMNKKFSRGFGQRLLAFSFLLYSIYQLNYFVVVTLNAFQFDLKLPNFLGIVDLLLIGMMGMGMVMWLLEDEREKLEKANLELDRFLYSTSHDLRAPIASILGLTYLGKLEFQEERARTFMDMIEARTKKLDMVISDILSLSRSKKVDLKIVNVELKNLLEDTITDIKFNKGASSIALEYQPDPSHVFQSDYQQMKIILSNLLANAVKYHNLDQPNPFIRLTFERTDDLVEISVEDNGKGIAHESLPKIFDMFYRASMDTEGTGLGLFIVKEALQKLKGTIQVKSELGKGSTFSIRLENA
jgi:signal transduction histidine kinase